MIRKLTHLLFFMMLCFPVFGQDETKEFGSAVIDEGLCVSLESDAPIQEFYILDISHLGFESEKDASDKMGFISNNLLTYSVDYEAETATLQVHLDRTLEPKDIVWWNEYQSSLCGLYHEE